VKKFWHWVKNETGEERTLHIRGVIAEESWLGNEVTPKIFEEELLSGTGDITVWIHSPGGETFAAARIYNLLMEYTGKVIVKIDGLAASAASVIAMAGGRVLMSPVSMLMIHNPCVLAFGDSEEMLRAKAMLDEVKESIINAYALKSGLSRAKISRIMDEETWLSAHKAVELGFADEIMFAERAKDAALPENAGFSFSRQAAVNSLLAKFKKKEPTENSTPVEPLLKRLSLLKP
jgi:ATP-dependent Clp protease protease subunit